MTVDGEDIRVGDIVVSPRTRRLFAGGHGVDLTSREFEILATMASHPGWVFSPEQLCDTSPESYSSPGAVNVHISSLRRKLARIGAPDVIETVRGAGYRVRRTREADPALAERLPFVGRSRELDALTLALLEARTGRSRFVLVSGEAGIGKTALVEKALAVSPSDRAIQLRASCDVSGAPQFWLWRQLVLGLPSGLTEPPGWPAVRRLIGLGSEDTQGRLLSASDRLIAYDSVLALLESACEQGPVVLFIDDLQWVHASSLQLLEYVLRRADGMRLLVVATCRDGDIASNEALGLFIAGVCGDSTLNLRLEGLGPGEVAVIAEHALGQRGRRLAPRVHGLTGGNPLFVCELVRALAKQVDGGSRGIGLARLPVTVDAIVRSRVSELPDQTRRALRVASAVGVEFDADIVGRACGSDGGVISDLAPALESLFIMETDRPGRLRFRHPVYRLALYESMSLPERQFVHAALYDSVRRSSRGHQRVFQLAHHSELAGPELAEIAVGCLAAAEREAFRRYAFEDAAGYARRALQVLDGASLPSDRAARVRAVLLERLGDCRAAAGESRGALDAYMGACRERNAEEATALARLAERISATEPGTGSAPE